jgi:hypothetical protein
MHTFFFIKTNESSLQRLTALQTDDDMLSDVIPDSKQISRQVNLNLAFR